MTQSVPVHWCGFIIKCHRARCLCSVVLCTIVSVYSCKPVYVYVLCSYHVYDCLCAYSCTPVYLYVLCSYHVYDCLCI